MSYRSDVAEAKRLAKRSEEDQWRLAELTWQNVRPQGDATRRQWADDVELSASYVGYLARVWDQYGVQQLHRRPTFSDALAKIITGDESTTGTRSTAETSLRAASPAAIAKAVADRADFQRAIARNRDAFEGVEDEGIRVRAREPIVDEGLGKRVGRAVGRALDIDETVEYLKGAARQLAHAVVAAEEVGVTDTDAEAEALRQIKRWLRIYEEKADITEADEEFLAKARIKF